MYKIKCPFLGCSGTIDIMEDIEDTLKMGQRKDTKVAKIGWMHSTFVCLKCRNIVGSITLEPGCWVSSTSKHEEIIVRNIIMNPRTKQGTSITVSDENDGLNPYLKIWALKNRPDSEPLKSGDWVRVDNADNALHECFGVILRVSNKICDVDFDGYIDFLHEYDLKKMKQYTKKSEESEEKTFRKLEFREGD